MTTPSPSLGSGRPAGRSGLGEEAYARLRAEIISGELAPDEPLSELALSQRLGISRTPVREALMRLAGDGLVRSGPGRGARVAGIDLTDIRELFQLREALEGLAARLAAGTVAVRGEGGDDDLSRLVADFAPYETAGPESSSEAYHPLARELDQVLVRLAGNRRLEATLCDVWAHSSRLRQYASSDLDRLRASAVEHVRILRAVQEGHGTRAEEAVREHLARSRAAVVAKVVEGHAYTPGEAGRAG